YFFVYKKSLIIADQKNYIVDIYQQIFYALQTVAQSIFLLLTRQFLPYLCMTIIFTFLNNYFVARKANQMYPYLTKKNVKPLAKSDIAGIVK
ncbi:MAG: lipopolysaccharide biosynthesis protein, partial [Lachnospiraceae bacterium]|nr:lipopolysaccharide biosynthesis protein [Lachnospiraceae bacterium]